jgi:ubiquinone/menaquinone biosynthesis C-methylase UbiE
MSFQKDPEKNETKFLRKLVDFTNKHVLEVGCGEGRLTWRYARSASRVNGIDPDLNAVRVAQYDQPSDLRKTTIFACASALHLPFPPEAFDLALLAWSL